MEMKITLKKIIKAFLPYGFLYLYRKYKNTKHNEYEINDDILNRITTFISYFMKTDINGNKYFDINGAKLPDISDNHEMMNILMKSVFENSFMIPFFFEDNHNQELIKILDIFMREGPGGYTDNEIDVTVKAQDVVIDAGAWIGDFSAYAASKGALSYAFEPVASTYNILLKTSELNNGRIIPIQKGLSNKNGITKINIVENNSGANSMAMKRSSKYEDISILTLDEFVKENNIKKIDFLKADIEGEERNLLKGAKNVLTEYAPKLAICTYHFPEDAKLLEEIILNINPNYKVKHLRHKLFAQAVS